MQIGALEHALQVAGEAQDKLLRSVRVLVQLEDLEREVQLLIK